MDICSTYLANIVHRDSSNLDYCDASGIGTGGVWVNSNKDGINRVW